MQSDHHSKLRFGDRLASRLSKCVIHDIKNSDRH